MLSARSKDFSVACETVRISNRDCISQTVDHRLVKTRLLYKGNGMGPSREP